jgi:hypothetical protein
VPQNKRKLQECQTVGEGSEPKSRNPKRQVPNSHADTPPDGSTSHPLLVSDDDSDKGDKISSPTSPDLSQDTLPDSEEFREKIDNHFSAKSEKAQLRADSSGTEPRPNTGIADSTVRNSPTCAQHLGFSCIAVGTNHTTPRSQASWIDRSPSSLPGSVTSSRMETTATMNSKEGSFERTLSAAYDAHKL